jgi:trigger factor
MRLRNSRTGDVITVTGAVAAHYRKLPGWKPVKQPKPAPAGGEFDPAEHNRDQVLEHLAGADGAERERVLTAERAGRARKTILEAAKEASS